jgi:hypothetical protein
VTLRDPHALPRLGFAVSLVVAPIAMLVSTLAAPPLEPDKAAQLAQMAAHPDGTYVFALLTVVSSMLFLPAVIGIVRLVAPSSPWFAYVGGGLMGVGVLVAVGDSFGLLWAWQMSATGGDRSQMAMLLQRADNAPGFEILFTIGGIAIVAGCVLLGAALWRSRAVPRFAAVALPVGTIANILGFSANSRVVLDVSALVLATAFAPVAAKLLGLAPRSGLAARPVHGT